MEALGLVIVVAVLIVLDLLALHVGRDSRDRIEAAPQRFFGG